MSGQAEGEKRQPPKSKREEWLTELNRRLDFSNDGTGWKWLCGNGEDRFFLARKAAEAVKGDFDALLAEEKAVTHAHCDCELIFNQPE